MTARTFCKATLTALTALALGCEASPTAPTRPVDATPTEVTEPAPAQTTPARTSAAEAACAAFDDLAAMDTRTPVPLQPMMAWHQKQNMMVHLVAIQRITDALSREEWDGVIEAAALIESSPQMETMCRHMGSGAPGFTELALEFHRAADTIAPAARQKSTAAVLSATSTTLQVCTSCHAAYKQDVVDATTWSDRTGDAHVPGHHPPH